MKIQETLEKFESYMKSRSYSLHTILTRIRSIRKFNRWLVSRNFMYHEVIEQDISEYKAYLISRSHSDHTILTHLGSIKSFYLWLFKSHEIFNNPAEDMTPNLKVDKLPYVLTEQQIDNIIRTVSNDKVSLTPMRNTAILELAYSSLLRRNELVNIKISDIDYNNQTARIIRKGNKEGLVPIGNKAIQAIKAYVNDERETLLLRNPDMACEYLWLSHTYGAKISYRSLDGIFRDIRNRQNMTEEFSLHTLRRSGATHMLQYGASLLIVRDMLGHENFKAIRHYLRLCTKDYHETLKKSEALK